MHRRELLIRRHRNDGDLFDRSFTNDTCMPQRTHIDEPHVLCRNEIRDLLLRSMRGEPLVIAIHRYNALSTHYSVTKHRFFGNGFSTCINNRCTTILLRIPQRLHSPVERLENALAITFM